jgi:hypothetical protein
MFLLHFPQMAGHSSDLSVLQASSQRRQLQIRENPSLWPPYQPNLGLECIYLQLR